MGVGQLRNETFLALAIEIERVQQEILTNTRATAVYNTVKIKWTNRSAEK